MNIFFQKNKDQFSAARVILLLMMALTPHQICLAQDNTLTLAQALEMAETNFPAIKAKGMYVKSAEQTLKETKREYIPAFKLHGQINYGSANSVTGTFFPYGVVVPTSGAIERGNNYDPVYGAIAMAYLEWAPFSFGQYKAKVEKSRVQLNYTSADLDKELFYHKIEVSNTYLSLMVFQLLKRSQEKNVERAEIIKNAVIETTISGLRPGADSSFANAELSKAKLELLDAERSEDETKAQLADLLGIPYQDFSLDTTIFLNRLPLLPTEQIPTDISNHPLIKLYDSEVRLSQSKEKVIAKGYFPKISLLGVTNGRGSGIGNNGVYDQSFLNGISLSRFNYAGAVACTFNILDYPRMKAELNAEKFKTEAAKAEYDEQAIKLKNEIAIAEEKMKLAMAKLKETPNEYKAAVDDYKQKLTLYNSGLSDLFGVAQAFYNLNKAEADLALAYDGVWKALLNKTAANGNFNLLLNNLK